MYCVRCKRTVSISQTSPDSPQVWELLAENGEFRGDGQPKYSVKRLTIAGSIQTSGTLFHDNHTIGLCPQCIINREGFNEERTS